MGELVNIVKRLQEEIRETQVTLDLEGDYLRVRGPGATARLHIVPLYRPSSSDVEREGAPDVLLVLTGATRKAVQAASRYNHVLVPGGGYRIFAPGVALYRDVPYRAETSRKAKLSGQTGVIAESLLIGKDTEWSVQGLASAARVAPSLAHRVLIRLEQEGLLSTSGQGPEKVRTVRNPRAMAELWGQEERVPEPFLRGFLYASSVDTLVQKAFDLCPSGALGGPLAANLYKPVLTRVTPPLRVWVPVDFDPVGLKSAGLETVDEGANLEFFQAKGDPWSVHRRQDPPPKVSPWRAWLEIANARGRTEELAEALLTELLDNDGWR